ncbi:hypothetical protein IE53DRAFT_377822 [Violaceomyces palustris]|uniref:Uncharacterized protein n=1 Tax=Violaceomyces palustris TaxID=1673888 RepID=A0ACD0P487_9BASI|nr:hypothetical protein IE53DRAFT_377822 [Violaceomyces palustris]
MRSSWLTTASAALVCAVALSNASRLPAEPNQKLAAEQLQYDQAGNLVWSDNQEQQDSVATNQHRLLPPLQRPDFSSLKIAPSNLVESTLERIQHEFEEVQDTLKDAIHKVEDQAQRLIHQAGEEAKSWMHAGTVLMDGVEYEKLIHPSFPDYALRLSKNTGSSFCDKDVVQHSGYLDISETKHLWFIFFESRSKPKEDPLVLWLSGGPGCSSSVGMLFELGPCAVADGGEGTKRNPFSWNNKANTIFLDQPVDVGYSYSDNDKVNNTPDAAEDVYAFLQLFLAKFPEYSKLEFTASGESYAGTYLPNVASVIHHKNKEASLARYADPSLAPIQINLKTVMIGNGLTAPQVQFPSLPEYLCDDESPYSLWKSDSPTCQSLRTKAQTCKSLIDQCQKYDSRLTCVPAALYCWSNLYGPAQQTGRNLYDLRRKCDRSEDKDGPLCYREMGWIETLLNKDDVKKQLGVPSSVHFQSCNTQVNQAFLLHGDSMHNSAALLPELIDDGKRVLIYAGEADAMCNWAGNKQWITALESSYGDEFRNATDKSWKMDGKQVGLVRKAGDGAGNVAFIQVHEAGHMVPTDQPAVAAEMLEKWLANKPLV